MRDNGLSIGELSQRTGVSVETIRIWERRHEVPSPRRTAGRHRRYSQEDAERVAWLAQRVAAGQRISEAVAALRALGRESAAAPGEALCERLVAAAIRADSVQVETDLGRAFRLFPLVEALELVVFPALRELGERWLAGEPAIAAEHLLSEAVTRRLSARLTAGTWRVESPIAIFCPSGEAHEIGALALAVLAIDEGIGVAYFGSNTPIDEIARLVAERHVRHAVAVCTMAQASTATLDYLAHRADAQTRWTVTGPALRERPERPPVRGTVAGSDLDAVSRHLRDVGATRTKRRRRATT